MGLVFNTTGCPEIRVTEHSSEIGLTLNADAALSLARALLELSDPLNAGEMGFSLMFGVWNGILEGKSLHLAVWKSTAEETCLERDFGWRSSDRPGRRVADIERDGRLIAVRQLVMDGVDQGQLLDRALKEIELFATEMLSDGGTPQGRDFVVLWEADGLSLLDGLRERARELSVELTVRPWREYAHIPKA